MGNRYLLLWLEGSLQSWGIDSKFNARSTQSFPSKSGILGICLAAAGKGGAQEELLSILAPCKQTVYVLKEGRILVDFQTAGTGYDSTDNWQRNMIPKKRDGGVAVGGGAKLIFKHYIQGGVFAIILEVPESCVDMMINSLNNPVWPIYLGRKNCIPSEAVLKGDFDSFDDAEKELEKILRSKEGLEVKKQVLDGDYPELGDVYPVCDVPLSFGKTKRYASRFITIVEK